MKSYEIVAEQYDAFEPSFSCGLAGGFLGALGFSNSSHLVHGSSGCGFAMRYGLSQHWKSFIPCPVTSFHERDVIFGGINLLKKSIDTIEKVNDSDVLFILTSCSSEIIGDDLEAVALEETENRNKKVIAIEVGGASGNVFNGYNDFLTKVVNDFYQRFLEDGFEEIEKGNDKQIDILGIIPRYDMFFRGDMFELRRIFNKLGVHVNSFLSGDCSKDSMAQLYKSDLALSISSSVGQKALARLRRFTGNQTAEFQVAPIGFEYTNRFYRETAEKLGLDQAMVAKVLEQEESEARQEMLRGFDFSKVMFTAGRVAIIGETSRTLALANLLLNEIGMRSLLIAFTTNATQADLDELDRILKIRNNQAIVLIEQDNYLIRKYLLETKPNLIFGRSLDRIKELTKTVNITWQFPSTDRLVIYDRPYLGYRGVVSIVDDIVNGFSKIWY